MIGYLIAAVIAGVGFLLCAAAAVLVGFDEQFRPQRLAPAALGLFLMFTAAGVAAGVFFLAPSATPAPYPPGPYAPYTPAPLDLRPAFATDPTGLADEFWAGVFGGLAAAIERDSERSLGGQATVDLLATLGRQAILASGYRVDLQPAIDAETAWLDEHAGEFGPAERGRVVASLRRLETACEAID